MKKVILTLCAIAFCGAVTLKADDTKPAKAKPTKEEMFKKLDTNGDGFLSEEEYLASPGAKKDPEKAKAHYKKMDKKGDGKVTLE
jgi:Ca2+-binding EF-hand superfamily protein